MAVKFQIGDRVVLNKRKPIFVEETNNKPRTVVACRYDSERQCCFYKLGDNYHGDKLVRWFRSYMLKLYRPRYGIVGRPRQKRKYNRHNSISKMSCQTNISQLKVSDLGQGSILPLTGAYNASF